MSLSTHHGTNWLTGSYAADLIFLLKVAENNKLRSLSNLTGLSPHLDSMGHLAIGYGFDLFENKKTAYDELVAVGALITDAAELKRQLSGLTVLVSEATKNKIAGLVSLPNEVAAEALLKNAVALREVGFDEFLASADVGVIVPSSKERVALMSLWYQGEKKYFRRMGRLTNLTNALKDGNRAEAWFEIRYGSAENGDNGDGVIIRRFVDANMFGLYENGPDVTSQEARSIYSMLQKHRSEILDWERRYGEPPDMLESALRPTGKDLIAPTRLIDSYNLTGVNAVPSLYDVLIPARNAFISWVNTQLPAGETKLIASDWNPAAIYLRESSIAGKIIDANADNGKGVRLDRNILVGDDRAGDLRGGAGDDVLIGGGADDILEGGPGADTMYGGVGDDTYIIDVVGGVGSDRIVDSDNKGRIVIQGSNYTISLGSLQKE